MQEYEQGWHNPSLVASSASPAEIEQYCYGECHVLAIALSRLTGWSMHVVLDHGEAYWSSDEDEYDTIPSVVHVLCLDNEGNFWDIRGKRHRDTLYEEMIGWCSIAKYGSDTHCDESDLRYYTGFWGEEGEGEIDRPLSEFTDADLDEATAVIKRVLVNVPGYAESVVDQVEASDSCSVQDVPEGDSSSAPVMR